MALATYGPTMPGIVATVFERPMRTPPKRGAMSRWLTAKPEKLRPREPTAMVRKMTAVTLLVPR